MFGSLLNDKTVSRSFSLVWCATEVFCLCCSCDRNGYCEGVQPRGLAIFSRSLLLYVKGTLETSSRHNLGLRKQVWECCS